MDSSMKSVQLKLGNAVKTCMPLEAARMFNRRTMGNLEKCFTTTGKILVDKDTSSYSYRIDSQNDLHCPQTILGDKGEKQGAQMKVEDIFSSSISFIHLCN